MKSKALFLKAIFLGPSRLWRAGNNLAEDYPRTALVPELLYKINLPKINQVDL